MSSKYSAPGVYVESIPSVVSVDESLSTGIGGFFGYAAWGPDTPVLISSWQEYIDIFAPFEDSPFVSRAQLAYADYGFFQNGGKQCYIHRVTGNAGAAASATVTYTPTGGSSTDLFELESKYIGVAGNSFVFSLTKLSGLVAGGDTYNYALKYGTDKIEEYSGSWSGLLNFITNESKYIEFSADPPASAPAGFPLNGVTANFSGGAASYGGQISTEANLKAWKAGESIDRVNYVADVDSSIVTSVLYPVINSRKETVIIAYSATATRVINDANTIAPEKVMVYAPKINVSDPLNNNELRAITPVGHVMGVFARIAQERGIWKAPAGTECILKGAVSVVSNIDVATYRNVGINAIVYKPNYGIVIWGARTQALNNDMAYVTDVLLDCYIKDAIDSALQPAVFEPNNSALWIRVKADIESILDTLWRAGGLAGSEANQAYYVKCDEDLNPASVRDAGELRVEVGYARSRPAEFIIVRVAHVINRG